MNQEMTNARILPVLLKFTIPLMIGNIFQQLYNMADTIIVGRFVGAGALAAVGSTGTIMFLLTGISQGMTAGFSVLTSQKYGAEDERGVRNSVANGIFLTIATALFLTAVSLLSMPTILRLMNTPADIYEDASTYIMLISAGFAANIFYNLFSALLRSVGNSKAPLCFLVFSACLNVLLDLLFIIRFHMGVAGAAIATNLSQGISALLSLGYIYLRVPALRPTRGDWKLNRNACKFQLRMAIPMSLQFAITSSGAMIMQSAINLFGSTAVAAFTAASKLQNVLMQGMIAMGQAMAAFCGQNYGAGKLSRVKAGVRTAMQISTVYSLTVAVLAWVLLPQVLRLFFSGNVDISVMLPWARTYIHLTVLFYIPLSMIFVFRNAMQGCGYGFLPMMGGVAEFFARLLTSRFAAALLSFPLACFCDPAAWVSAALVTAISYRYVMGKIERKSASQ